MTYDLTNHTIYCELNYFRILFPQSNYPTRATWIPENGSLPPPALKNFFESNLNFKGFHEVNRIVALAGTARGASGTIIFGGKDPEATLKVGLT